MADECPNGGRHIWERHIADDDDDMFQLDTATEDDVIHIYVCDKCELVRERDETDGR